MERAVINRHMITTYNLQKKSTAYKTLSLLVYIQELTYFQMRNI